MWDKSISKIIIMIKIIIKVKYFSAIFHMLSSGNFSE
jgi:hypothetical protein